MCNKLIYLSRTFRGNRKPIVPYVHILFFSGCWLRQCTKRHSYYSQGYKRNVVFLPYIIIIVITRSATTKQSDLRDYGLLRFARNDQSSLQFFHLVPWILGANKRFVAEVAQIFLGKTCDYRSFFANQPFRKTKL